MPAPILVHSEPDLQLWQGDCLDVLRTLPDASVHAVLCDPPYGLAELPTARVVQALAAWLGGDREHVPDGRGFMGREWDRFVPPPAVWDECYRVLKPGGHLLAFAAPRTQDLMGLSIRLAGFRIFDGIDWLFGQGWPKSVDIGKAIDAAAGAAREVVGVHRRHGGGAEQSGSMSGPLGTASELPRCAPATPEAQRWDGWGTGLKPAHECIVVARKPPARSITANVLAHGVGALNIDGCKVGTTRAVPASDSTRKTAAVYGRYAAGGGPDNLDPDMGRWPPNIVLSHAPGCRPAGTRRVRGSRVDKPSGALPGDRSAYSDGMNGARPARGIGDADGLETIEVWSCADGCPVAELDAQSGQSAGQVGMTQHSSDSATFTGLRTGEASTGGDGAADYGGASRFFPVFRYQAKAPASERPRLADGTGHNTVKPLELIRWIARLICPGGGTIADPFGGTFTTASACWLEGFACITMDNDPKAVQLGLERLRRPHQPAWW